MSTPPTNSIEVTTRTAWRRWLTRHHNQADGVWLISYRKHVTSSFLAYDAQQAGGVYSVTVEHDGYGEWRMEGVQVRSDECHVETMRLSAHLQRTP